jgi:hypothetical protein
VPGRVGPCQIGLGPGARLDIYTQEEACSIHLHPHAALRAAALRETRLVIGRHVADGVRVSRSAQSSSPTIIRVTWSYIWSRPQGTRPGCGDVAIAGANDWRVEIKEQRGARDDQIIDHHVTSYIAIIA